MINSNLPWQRLLTSIFPAYTFNYRDSCSEIDGADFSPHLTVGFASLPEYLAPTNPDSKRNTLLEPQLT